MNYRSSTSLLAQSRDELLDRELRNRGVIAMLGFDHMHRCWTVAAANSNAPALSICDRELDRMISDVRPEPLLLIAARLYSLRAPDEGMFLTPEGSEFLDRVAVRLLNGEPHGPHRP